MDSNPEFGIWLRRNRDASKLTLMELGERADTTHTTIQRIEKGKRGVSRKMVARLAGALGASVEEALAEAGFAPHANEASARYIITKSVNLAPGINADFHFPPGEEGVITDDVLDRLKLDIEISKRKAQAH